MSRSSVLPRRVATVALAALACLAAGITSAQAAPAGAGAGVVAGSRYQARTSVTDACPLDPTSSYYPGAAAAGRSDCSGAPNKAVTVPEVRTFTGSGLGTGPSQAVDGAVRMAYTSAQWAGWQSTQCYVRGTDVRWAGIGVYTAVAELFCQR
ncbi:hypothetical protein [Streptomyces yangpuensis]|uniref:hypothetical protein n=1 Tax=Streptomyces yangpuensis TaxID=1648182 RepID=UPI00380B0CFD